MKNSLWRTIAKSLGLAGAVIIGVVGARTVQLSHAGRCSLVGTLHWQYHNYRLRRSIDAFRRANSLVRRDPAGFDLWKTPKGSFWVPQGNDSTLPLELAEQKLHIYGHPPFSVRRGDIVLDCGAGVGVYAMEALAAGAAQVIAIEPVPENIECLRRNLGRDIEAGRVLVYPKGVWDRDAVLSLRVNPTFSGMSSLVLEKNRVASAVTVPLTTIDHLAEELRLQRVDFIKMDIEGAEQPALAGAQRVIARYRPRLAISVYHRPDDLDKVPQLVRRACPTCPVECGPCGYESGRFQPELLYFR